MAKYSIRKNQENIISDMTSSNLCKSSFILLYLLFLVSGNVVRETSIAVEEHKPFTFSCEIDSHHHLIWSIVARNQTQRVATCQPSWTFVECTLTSEDYNDLYFVRDWRPYPTSLTLWSSLTVYRVDRGLSKVICQHGFPHNITYNITNILVAVKPRELECDEPLKATPGSRFNITCRFLVFPTGRCSLVAAPPLLLHTISTIYTHRFNWQHDVYTTSCTIQAVVDLSTYRNVSMFQVLAEPDAGVRMNLSVASHWMSLEATDKSMTFTANSLSKDVEVEKGSELAFVCYISNAPGVILRLFKGSTVIALHTAAHSDRLHFVVRSTDCDDTATYTCHAEHGVRLDQKLNVTIKSCQVDNEESSSLPYMIVAYTAVPILTLVIIIHVVFCIRYVRRKQRIRRSTESSEGSHLDPVVQLGSASESPELSDLPGDRRTVLSHNVTPLHSGHSSPFGSPHSTPSRSRHSTPFPSRHTSPLPSLHSTPRRSRHHDNHHHPRDDDFQENDIDATYAEISIISDPPNYNALFQENGMRPYDAFMPTTSNDLPLPPSYSSVMLNNLANMASSRERNQPKMSAHIGQDVIDTHL